ncbi:MAG: DUF4080 domain-containing protein [Acutalibacteraceae bacterium]
MNGEQASYKVRNDCYAASFTTKYYYGVIMNVVICSINSKYIHSSLAPWCLYAGVGEYCKKSINVTVIEGTINEDIRFVAKRITKLSPDAIGFCCYIWNINFVYSLINSVKKELPNCKIILGGPEVSYNCESILTERKYIDYIVSGEGEKSFPQLLNCIENGIEPENIDGVNYKCKNGLHLTPPAILKDDPISPYTEEYFNNLNGRITYIETSRGCPYSCAFCLSGRCGKVRFFDTERAKKDIITLANSGTKTVKFVDRTFNSDKARAKELYRFIIDNYNNGNIPRNVCFHFEIAGDILDRETIQILTTAPKGLFQLEIGMQSFNEKTLSCINRKTDTEKLRENILKLTENHNMHIHIDLIAGLPFEDFESFKESFNIGFSLNSNMLQLGFLKLLHGADMRENQEKYVCKFNKEPPYEVISTPYLSEQELKILHGVEDAVDRIYNSGRFKRTVDYAVKTSGVSPFDFFLGFSKFIERVSTEKITLDKYTELLFNYVKTLKNIKADELRDIMVCDRLSTNASGKIPEILKVYDKRLKKYKAFLNNSEEYKQNQKSVRGVAILYSQNKLVYVDYFNDHGVDGEYELKFVDINLLCE